MGQRCHPSLWSTSPSMEDMIDETWPNLKSPEHRTNIHYSTQRNATVRMTATSLPCVWRNNTDQYGVAKQTNKWNTPHCTLCTAIPLPGCHTATKRRWSHGSTLRPHSLLSGWRVDGSDTMLNVGGGGPREGPLVRGLAIAFNNCPPLMGRNQWLPTRVAEIEINMINFNF